MAGGGESSIERKETNQIQGPGSLPGPPKHAPEHGRFVYLFREISNSLSDSENILSLFQLLCECSNMRRSGTNSHLSIFNNSQHSTYLFYLPLSHPASFILSGIFSSKSKALWYFTCKQLSMHLQQIGLISFWHNNLAIITSNRISNNPLISRSNLTLKGYDFEVVLFESGFEEGQHVTFDCLLMLFYSLTAPLFLMSSIWWGNKLFYPVECHSF